MQQEEIINYINLRRNELQIAGIPEPELTRAIFAELYDLVPEGLPWPGPVTGIDNAGANNMVIVPDTGYPPVVQNNVPGYVTEPFGITNLNPYPNNPTPDPNSKGNYSNTYDFTNPPAKPSDNWTHDASVVGSEPSMHGLEGWVGSKAIPEWRYPIEAYPVVSPDIVIPASDYQIQEVSQSFKDNLMNKKEKKSLLKKLAPYLGIIGGLAAMSSLVNSYLDNADDTIQKDNDLKDKAEWREKVGKFFASKPIEVHAEFVLSPTHKGTDVCDDYAGKTFNLLDKENRPVLPSEGLGYVNLTHPHCHCTWKIVKKKDVSDDSLTRAQDSEHGKIESHIARAAKKHTLHTVKPDGDLSKKTRGTNPIKEIIGMVRHEFDWLGEDYLNNAKAFAKSHNAKLYLIRAAAEAVTDHRAEGEKYKRKLIGEELASMARTATGKSMDINHIPEYKTDAIIIDSEYNPRRKEIQMIVMEADPEINRFIKEGKIDAVSINGGSPRVETLEPCNSGCAGDTCELCAVPRGVILAEIDGIGMTWAVTANSGIFWRGKHIPGAEPGIKTTVIEPL